MPAFFLKVSFHPEKNPWLKQLWDRDTVKYTLGEGEKAQSSSGTIGCLAIRSVGYSSVCALQRNGKLSVLTSVYCCNVQNMDCDILNSFGEIRENSIEMYVRIPRYQNLCKHDVNSEIMNKLRPKGVIISQRILNHSGLIPDSCI